MFLEHVLLKHPVVPVTFARRLELVSCQHVHETIYYKFNTVLFAVPT